MTQPESQPDGSAPVSRRDLLRLGAASLGAPLLAPSTTPHAAADRPTRVHAEAIPLSDFPAWEAFPLWEGEDYPDHPDPRARTINNLKFMGLAMHNFAAMNGCRFPAAAMRRGDKAILSWRVAILPFLEQFALYERFHLDEAWDSPHNASLLKEMPRVYAPVTPRETTAYTTYYQWVVGPGSLFDGDEGTRADVNIFARPTLMIVEAAEPVPWTKPEDLPYEDGKPLLRLGGPFEDGSYVTFADGSVRFLSREHSTETLRALITQRRRQGDSL
jgi:Protein of unknown function (DUF1559)